MNNNQQKWLFSFVIFLLYLCLSAPLWYKIFNNSRIPYWVFPVIMSIVIFFITRLLLIWWFTNTNESFKGLHNVGQSLKCSIQRSKNIENNCSTCEIAAFDCLNNQSCNDDSMKKCENDTSCNLLDRHSTIKECRNLSTN